MNEKEKFPPTHPRKIIERRFFQVRYLTVDKVAKEIHLPIYQLQELIDGQRNIDLDLAYRLGFYFQVGAEGFLNLQQIYDLAIWSDRQEELVKKSIRPFHPSKSTSNFKSV